jgi:hypothetical protein
VYDDGTNVGIGTSSPGAKLEVVGKIKATSIDVGTTAGQTLDLFKIGSANYIWAPDAAPILIGTSNTERMRIDSSGNVGIGTSSPSSFGRLAAVSASTNGSAITAVSSSTGATDYAKITFFHTGNDTFTLEGGSVGLIFKQSGNIERMRIDGSGNVGIGTSSPVTRLTVDGGAASLRTGNQFRFYPTANNNYSQIYNPTGGQMAFDSGAGEAMRIDGSGNVGIGTTSPTQKFEVNGSGTYAARFNRTGVAAIRVSVGANGLYGIDTESADLQLGVNGTERARIDSSGNLLVGTTSGSGAISVARGGGVSAFIEIAGNGNTIGTNSMLLGQDTNSSGYCWNRANAVLLFGTNNTERARIDSGGNLLVGTTSATFGTSVGMRVFYTGSRMELGATDSTNDTVGYDMYSTGASAYRFFVGWGGTIYATSTSISAISDQRLKENVRDLDAGLDTILALKPRRFDWKEGKGKDVKDDMGFIAQEVEEVLPALIGDWKAGEGEPDDLKSVKAGDLIPVLVKAIQELTARVAQLEGK